MIRVLVLASSTVVRAGLHAMLREDGRFEVVAGEFPLIQLQRVNWHKPGIESDVVLAEITGKRLASLSPAPDGAESIPLVLLIDDVTRGELLRAIHNGARAILPRTAQPAEIFAAIEAVAAGLTAFGPDELDLLLPSASDIEPEAALEALSGREIEVLALMAQGLANKGIADRLNISEHTVKFHVSSILSKLAASSRTDAVTRGLKAGLLVI
jgi:DNA-binding NarL/FixJ family response regulator